MSSQSNSNRETADIGVVGLAVMGQNLALNFEEKGYTVSVYNRTTSKVDEFMSIEAKNRSIIGCKTLEDFLATLKQKPRKVMLLIKAGKPVEDLFNQIVPLLEKGDILIDAGNSEYTDTVRRIKLAQKAGILYVGAGISGGEDAARSGASINPGGDPEAWPHIKDVLQSVAARIDGEICCDWLGSGGAGHFVKAVHNGIEYGDIQMICETYHLLKSVAGMSNDEIANTFREWNKGSSESFLLEMASDILSYRDQKGVHVIDTVYDCAGQKGSGRWTAVAALDSGVPMTVIAESVFARCLSSMKTERMDVSERLKGPKNIPPLLEDRKSFVEDVRHALTCSKIISYSQAFMLLRKVSKQWGWNLNLRNIAVQWRLGCIIQSKFLTYVKDAYKNPKLKNLLVSDELNSLINNHEDKLRRVVIKAVERGVPVPAFTSAITYYDGYRSEWLPHNLLQALRDYFGAHTYSTQDQPDQFVHTDWSGSGGRVTSSAYDYEG